MEKGQAGRLEDQESGVMKAGGGEHVSGAWDLGDLDGSLGIILEGLGVSALSSLDLNFPNVIWENRPWTRECSVPTFQDSRPPP